MSFYRLTSAFLILSHSTYFLCGTCILGALPFSDGIGLIFVVVGIKYGRELIFSILQYLQN